MINEAHEILQKNFKNVRLLHKIRSLRREDILSMLDEQEKEGKARELEAVCRFCQSAYTFTEKELL